jgi:ABC-type uncharacterized transport system substrate-binding protein
MPNVKRILAVAVGPDQDVVIGAGNRARLGEVRPYVGGLVAGLERLGHLLGDDFEIVYRERSQTIFDQQESAEKAFETSVDLIFAMSTTVLRAGVNAPGSVPFVYASVSDVIADKIMVEKKIVAGVNARRTETIGDCLRRFVATVPTLKTVHYLTKDGYPPGDRAWAKVEAAAKDLSQRINRISVTSQDDIMRRLQELPARALDQEVSEGTLVGPVDTCLSAVPLIISISQGAKNLPVFLPVRDWVKPELPSALGSYGVSQDTCGRLAAKHVDNMLWPHSGPTFDPVTKAPDSAIEWVTSTAAADALNIAVPRVV